MICSNPGRESRRTLSDIFAEPDPLGLLEVKIRQSIPSGDQRLMACFQEIEQFMARHGHEPAQDANDFEEARLGTRLAAIRANPDQGAILEDMDAFGLLRSAPTQKNVDTFSIPAPTQPADIASAKPAPEAAHQVTPQNSVTSLDDIWASDALGLLDTGDESLFNLRHVPRYEKRDMPDDIAQRKHCDDFYRFETLFEKVHQQLNAGELETVSFQKESQISEGDMFILNGMLCIADQVGKETVGAGKKFNPRLRVVFSNGTESNLLLRSLARALYKDESGRRILQRDNTFNELQGITHHDSRVGAVYILQSLSQNPKIQSIRNLYKIGYTEHSVESRIVDADKDRTFLEAPVRIVTTFECYNFNPHRFERLIHAMLGQQRVNMTLRSQDGSSYKPREWFDVELDTAREVIRRIVDGSIIDYRIDNVTGRIAKKLSKS